jgi:RimJ/RimL family protein N-acetyltransferase
MGIILRPIKENDSAMLYNWVNDKELVRKTFYYHPVSEMEHKEWFNAFLKKQNQYVFGIEEIESNELIGLCGLYDIDFIHRKGELKMKIGTKKYRGKGFGFLALIQLVRFGFEDINLHRIWLKVHEDNLPAISIYEKAGFTREGLLLEDMFVGGLYKNVLIMGMISK